MEKILNGRNEYKLSCADGDYTVGGSIEKNEGMDVVRISFESASETVPPVISLTAEQKEQVTNYGVLEAAVERYNELYSTDPRIRKRRLSPCRTDRRLRRAHRRRGASVL